MRNDLQSSRFGAQAPKNAVQICQAGDLGWCREPQLQAELDARRRCRPLLHGEEALAGTGGEAAGAGRPDEIPFTTASGVVFFRLTEMARIKRIPRVSSDIRRAAVRWRNETKNDRSRLV
jgi:hypothetical protein